MDRQKKITIYHNDGTEEVIFSKKYDDNEWSAGGITAIGYSIYDENNAQIIVQPTLHKKIKIEEIKCHD